MGTALLQYAAVRISRDSGVVLEARGNVAGSQRGIVTICQFTASRAQLNVRLMYR